MTIDETRRAYLEKDLLNALKVDYPSVEQIDYRITQTVHVTFAPASYLEGEKTIIVDVDGLSTRIIADKVKRAVIEECGGVGCKL